MDAAAWIVGLNLLSVHTDGLQRWEYVIPQSAMAAAHRVVTTEPLRSVTPGLYLRSPTGATFGVLRNSFGATSVHAGWTWHTDDQRFAFTAGGITGYPGMRLAPLLVPSVRFDPFNGAAPAIRISALVTQKPNDGRWHTVNRTGASLAVHFSLEHTWR